MIILILQRRRNEFESGGHRFGAKRRKKIYFGRAPPLFGSRSTISRFGERCRGGQYSLVSFFIIVIIINIFKVA